MISPYSDISGASQSTQSLWNIAFDVLPLFQSRCRHLESAICKLMTTDAPTSTRTPRFTKPAHYFLCLLLIAFCWFSHFSRFREMGFYEDDHWFAVSTLAWSPHEMLGWIWEQIRVFPRPQGRPIGFILGDLIPWISYRVGGLPAIYIAGWMVFSTNTILFFTLLRRCLAPPLPLIGAFGFIFFPADTTRPFICHADILQPSITFTLIACHLQLSNRSTCRYLAYLFALFSLLTYETAMLPFVVFPLLNQHWNWRWARRFAIHLFILAIVGAGFFAVRKAGGESRVIDASMTTRIVAQRIWTGTGIGANTVLKVSQSRADQGEDDFMERRQPRSELKTAAAFIGLSVLGASLAGRISEPSTPRLTYKDLFTSALRAAAFGIAGLSISYLFCFTHYPPNYEEGRITSTHLAATLPVATLMAVIAIIPILLLPRVMGHLVTAAAVGFYFMYLFAAARDEQRGYVQIWRARQQLWTRIIDCCPDITDCTLIAFEGTVPQPAYYMGTASWSDYMVLGEIFNFAPSHFHRDPMAAHFPAGPDGEPIWQNDIHLDSAGQFIWNQSPFGVSSNQEVFDHNLILLHIDPTGAVTRRQGTIQLCGRVFHLKDLPATGASPAFPKLPLYGIVTGRTR
jgi:hypothetical protein